MKKPIKTLILASSIFLMNPAITFAKEGSTDSNIQPKTVQVATSTTSAHTDEAQKQKVWKIRDKQVIEKDMALDLEEGNNYTIRWGDTLSMISQVVNESVSAIAKRNNIANSNLIYAGSQLVFDEETRTHFIELNKAMGVEDENGNELPFVKFLYPVESNDNSN